MCQGKKMGHTEQGTFAEINKLTLFNDLHMLADSAGIKDKIKIQVYPIDILIYELSRLSKGDN